MPIFSQSQRYREVQAATASPAELVVLLYEAAIGAVRQARRFLEERDFNHAHQQTVKAQKAIAELLAVLDCERGGRLAANLQDIYRFLLQHLMQANLHKDGKRLAEVEQLLEPLRDAWAQLAKTFS